MTTVQAHRDDLIRAGYQAPVRKSLIEPQHLWGCPRLMALGWTLLCGLLFLVGLPEVARMLSMPFHGWSAALLCGGLWLGGVVLMVALTRFDAQWMEIALQAMRRRGRLEV